VVALGAVDVIAVDTMALDGGFSDSWQTDETNATWAFVDSLCNDAHQDDGDGSGSGGGGGRRSCGVGGVVASGASGGSRGSGGVDVASGDGELITNAGVGGGRRLAGIGEEVGGVRGAGHDNIGTCRRRPRVLLSHLPLPKRSYLAGSCGLHRRRPVIVQRITRSSEGVHYQDYLTEKSARRWGPARRGGASCLEPASPRIHIDRHLGT